MTASRYHCGSPWSPPPAAEPRDWCDGGVREALPRRPVGSVAAGAENGWGAGGGVALPEVEVLHVRNGTRPTGELRPGATAAHADSTRATQGSGRRPAPLTSGTIDAWSAIEIQPLRPAPSLPLLPMPTAPPRQR